MEIDTTSDIDVYRFTLGRYAFGIGASWEDCLFGISWRAPTFIIHIGPFILLTAKT